MDPEITFEGEYAKIPEMLRNSLEWYVKQGQLLGGFLEAVVSNDLNDAAIRGDLESRRQLSTIALWVHHKTPGACHGSRAAYQAWVKQKGLKGVL